ncbi:DUF2125 domain-containing protein [Shimia aestuarii]|uniref:DUF2125 domain-containing protein n=1 Tax=Shimia aestuarii TaxID=254406 RepID=UPI001FB46C6E|nr:DUF2125 domain-containing protein [Shimia aestuarii]
MKRLLIVIIVLTLGWSAYWFVGATRAKSGFEDWLAARQAEGWLAETSDIAVRGFPNRFDATFSDVALADPGTGVAWEAPFFQLFALSYRPNHLIAIWPHEQVLAFPDQRVTVKSEDMKASLIVAGAPSLPLERSNLAVDALALVSEAGWSLSAETLRLAMHKDPESEATYRMALSATGFAPPAEIAARSGAALPRTLKTVEADLSATFARPWDITALEDSRPQPTALDLHMAQLTWGRLDLHAAGQVDIDPSGYPQGEITLRATNWREIIALARQGEELPAALIDGIEQGLQLLSAMAGNPKTLDIPLNFRGGLTRIGPVPIGPAPRLILR